MIIEGLKVAAAYGGFILACFGAAAIVRALVPQWFDGGQENG